MLPKDPDDSQLKCADNYGDKCDEDDDKENTTTTRAELAEAVRDALDGSDSRQRLVNEALGPTNNNSNSHEASNNSHMPRRRNESTSTTRGGRPTTDYRLSSLYDYVYSELRRGYFLENDEQRYHDRREKFYILLKIPWELERFMWYGFFQCVDAFLFVFTLLPIRFCLSIWFLVTRSCKRTVSYLSAKSRGTTIVLSPILQPAEICDLLKCTIVVSGACLISYIDTSMLYHIIKSQSVIKLYIFFNMLEVADKLLSSFGQDILDALFWTATEPRDRKRERLGVIPHFGMAVGYVCVHSILVLLQATTLNVAINSKNKALLTVMMSNNFVELKGMVFKKFEKNNLFHMSCSDVRERFHYLILMIVVIIQTMKEYNWSEEQFWILLPDCLLVLTAEIFIDWFKHAFVTRFNEISYEVYEDYSISLAYDLASSKLRSAFSDHSDLVSRRMGFIPLPLGVLVIRIFVGSFQIRWWYGYACILLAYFCLMTLKIVLNIILLGHSVDLIDQHRASMDKKIPQPRQCTSLPASRHGSIDDIPSALANNLIGQAKSTPHTPSPSASSSLADITAQAAIMQETLETSLILSDSTVSLMSLDINDGSKLALPTDHQPFTDMTNKDPVGDVISPHAGKSILRHRNAGEHRRRVSLQDVTTLNSSVNYLDLSADNK